MDKKVQEAASVTIFATIILAIFMLSGFIPIPESPTYGKWIKVTIGLVVYGIVMFIMLLFLKFKFGK